MNRLSASDTWTGDYLVERGIITLQQFDEAAGLIHDWDASFSDVLMARRWVKPIDYYTVLAERFGVDFVRLREDPPDTELLIEAEVDDYMRELTMPWRCRDGRLVIATARPGPEALLYMRRRWGSAIDVVVTAKFDILWSLQKNFQASHSHRAVYELADSDPEMSAQTVFTRSQIAGAWLLLTVFVLGLAFAPIMTLIIVNAIMSLFYLGNFLFKGA